MTITSTVRVFKTAEEPPSADTIADRLSVVPEWGKNLGTSRDHMCFHIPVKMPSPYPKPHKNPASDTPKEHLAEENGSFYIAGGFVRKNYKLHTLFRRNGAVSV